jgi:hypothetical protein
MLEAGWSYLLDPVVVLSNREMDALSWLSESIQIT